MKKFYAEAIDENGYTVGRNTQANSEAEAIRKIESDGCTVTEIVAGPDYTHCTGCLGRVTSTDDGYSNCCNEPVSW